MSKTLLAPEFGQLMQQVQESLQASVIAMLLQRRDGNFELACPPELRDDVRRIIEAIQWEAPRPEPSDGP